MVWIKFGLVIWFLLLGLLFLLAYVLNSFSNPREVTTGKRYQELEILGVKLLTYSKEDWLKSRKGY